MASISPDTTRHLFTTLFLSTVVTLPSPAQEAGQKEPALSDLAEAGRATQKRLEQQAAAWSAVFPLAGNNRIVVDILNTPTQRKSVLRIEAQGQQSEVLRIITRDGIWYTTEGNKAGKYRPYEAPFDLATAYFFLTRSDPICLAQTAGLKLGTYKGTRNGVATYRTPLDERNQRLLQNLLNEYEDLEQRNPQQAAKLSITQPVQRIRDLIENGTPTKVDTKHGIVVQFGAAQQQTELQNFQWLDQVAAAEFNVEGKNWTDFTDDPTDKDNSELLMISHSGTWRPGTKTGDTDGRLIDLKTGRLRRIAFHGAVSSPGCFLGDRRRVVVSGLNALAGAMGLYEVNLKTGENRQLGGELLASGFTLMPALSPDGQTLAVLHNGASERILQTQLCLVDLRTGSARRLGKPHDMAFVSWLPDGKGLIVTVRESPDPADPSVPKTATIARMDLQGQTTKIRPGTFPLLLNDGKTILFEDTTSRTWNTCDLDGGNAKLYAGGLAGHGFPSPAPDGKRIIMMHFQSGGAPVPVILPLGESKGEPAVKAPGLWTTPAWR
jgi:Tol biopolymer transport system component